MSPANRYVTPSQAATHLGVSTKALRLYEDFGLITPERSAAGWRLYDAPTLRRGKEVISLRALGLSLAQIAGVLKGDPDQADAGLAVHEAKLNREARRIDGQLKEVRRLRSDIQSGVAPALTALNDALARDVGIEASFPLPWPWDGERFEFRGSQPLNFITGPLGSGKTRLAERLAAALPDASFLGLSRLIDGDHRHQVENDAALAARIETALTWLEGDGAERSEALVTLITALEADTPSTLVIDMVEEGLDDETQQALMAYLRAGPPRNRCLFLMTRSSSILDPESVRAGEAIIYCPANHSPPFLAAAYPGGAGYEAVTTCLAAPAVRARTAGTVAFRPQAKS